MLSERKFNSGSEILTRLSELVPEQYRRHCCAFMFFRTPCRRLCGDAETYCAELSFFIHDVSFGSSKQDPTIHHKCFLNQKHTMC
jgi:hypothetical protein